VRGYIPECTEELLLDAGFPSRETASSRAGTKEKRDADWL
jgi:hypothetical protein